MNSIKKCLVTGLALATLSAGLYCVSRNPVTIIPVGIWPNEQNPESVTIYNPQNKRLSYVDKKPFGSVDYVIDYTSGKRVERKPKAEDCEKFSELEKIAIERGLIPPSVR